MKKIILAISGILFSLFSNGQELAQYFDGADTIPSETLLIEFDTSATNIWQVGPPQKIIFDAASTVPNVLVTDTINTYPDSITSSFQFFIPYDVVGWSLAFAIQWNQKIDFELNQDGGLVEFSADSGLTWNNAFTHPDVYNFYGFEIIGGTLPSGEPCFTGTDTNWRNIWLCFLSDIVSEDNDFIVRFTFVSDTNNTNQEGWMIDNFLVQPTFFHPVAEQSRPDNFKVYPTLVERSLTLEKINMSSDFMVKSISIIDLGGNLIRSVSNLSDVDMIDVSDLPAGKYLLKIESSEKKEIHPFVIVK